MESNQSYVQKSDANTAQHSVVDNFFSSLKDLSKKLDCDVSILETKVKSQVSRAVTSKDGEFAAPIADDINDELTDLNK